MKHLISLIIAIVALLMSVQVQAQNVITIAVPEFEQSGLSDALLAHFEEAHGVDVQVVTARPDAYPATISQDINSYLDNFAAYVSQADVLYLPSSQMAVEATRAGYLLNISPFSPPQTDFFPPLGTAYQWDGGQWAIPMTVDPQAIIYDVAAFDAAGLPYPDASWTLDDYGNAARALTQYADDGSVARAGFLLPEPSLLLRAVIGADFADDTAIPAAPTLDDPTLAAQAAVLQSLMAEGAITQTGGGMGMPDFPLMVTQAVQVEMTQSSERQFATAPLPNGTFGMNIDGLAISGGTANPELAYALVDFLSREGQFVGGLGFIPARPSLLTASSVPVSPQIEAMLQSGVTPAQRRFDHYVGAALDRSLATGMDVAQSLAEMQLTALDNLTQAATRQQSRIIVDVPAGDPVNGVTLQFEFAANMMPLPQQAELEQLAALFAESNPDVGAIDISVPMQGVTQEADCFYASSNYLNNIDVNTLMSLSPFIDTDAAFDTAQLLPGVQNQVEREGRVYAMPITVQPGLLSFNRSTFSTAGLDVAPMTWTIDELLNMVDMLRFAVPEGTPVLGPTDAGNTFYLSLIAAFGGVPFDYSTQPATLNLTDPATVAAIQQVLDLARDGTIAYVGLEDVIAGITGPDNALNHEVLVKLGFGNAFVPNSEQYGLTTYPTGTTYTPLTYSIGAGYINATSQHGDACYGWLRMLADSAPQLGAMPVTQSLVDSVNDVENSDLYRAFVTQMTAPNAVSIPLRNGWGNSANAVEQVWFNRALDAYVFNGADLAQGLADAETTIRAFRGCMDNGSTPVQCAIRIDPSLDSRF